MLAFHLFPLSRREIEGRPQAPMPWKTGLMGEKVRGSGHSSGSKSFAYLKLWKGLLRGGYPELAAYPGRDSNLWHGRYIQTYLTRDVRTLR